MSSGNNRGISPSKVFLYKIFEIIEREVHNWTNRWSSSCHSRSVASVGASRMLRKKMVMRRRILDRAVWRVMVIHRTLSVPHRRFKYLSFMALERLSGEGILEAAGCRVSD